MNDDIDVEMTVINLNNNDIVVEDNGMNNEINVPQPILLEKKGLKKYFTKQCIFYSPSFTILVTIVDIAMFIWTMVMNGGFENPSLNPMLGPSALTLLKAGAKWTPLILKGQWWRLISAMFLHAGIIHLITNLISQLMIGWILEKKFGTIRYAILYLVSGIMGNVTSAIFIPDLLTVGCSGALFGCIALWLVDVCQNLQLKDLNCSNIEKERRCAAFLGTNWCIAIILVVSILCTFALGLLPYIDNFAHVGGFVFGLYISVAMFPQYNFIKEEKPWKRKVIVRFIMCFIFAMLFIANTVGFFYLLYCMPNVLTWCSYCSYFTCIPMIVNGKDWCRQI